MWFVSTWYDFYQVREFMTNLLDNLADKTENLDQCKGVASAVADLTSNPDQTSSSSRVRLPKLWKYVVLITFDRNLVIALRKTINSDMIIFTNYFSPLVAVLSTRVWAQWKKSLEMPTLIQLKMHRLVSPIAKIC